MIRTKIIKIRLTEQEIKVFENKAARFGSRSAMVRKAVEVFDNKAVTDKIERIKTLTELFKKIDRELAVMGSNLNQTAKRVNELENANMLTAPYIKSAVLPIVNDTLSLLSQIKLEFFQEVKSAVR